MFHTAAMRFLSVILSLLTLSACATPGDGPIESAGERNARIKSEM